MLEQIKKLFLEEQKKLLQKIDLAIKIKTGCDYVKKYQTAVIANSQSLNVEEENVRLKISRWAEKFGYDYNEVKEKILADRMFSLNFIKDPSKQNIYELTAIEFLSCFFDYNCFNKLPAGGNGAIYLNSFGRIETYPPSITSTKSIDFFAKKENDIFFITHKYTKESGGAQDNQFNDVKHFLLNAMKSDPSLGYCVAILDGDYYKNKFDYLKNNFRKENIFIGNIEEFTSFIYRKYE